MQNRWAHPEKKGSGGREWASVTQMCGSGFPAATNRIYSRQFSRETSLKICILRCSGGQEISLCGYPARSIIQLPWRDCCGEPFQPLLGAHTAACTVAFRPRMLPSVPFWLRGQSFCWHPSREWGMVTGLPSLFTPSHFFLTSGERAPSIGLWFIVHIACCKEASRPWVSSSLPPCHQDLCFRWWGRWYRTRNSMNIGLTDLIVVCLTHSTVNELW